MVAPGDDAGGHVEEAFAAQEIRQPLSGVHPAAMQVGFAAPREWAAELADPHNSSGRAMR